MKKLKKNGIFLALLLIITAFSSCNNEQELTSVMDEISNKASSEFATEPVPTLPHDIYKDAEGQTIYYLSEDSPYDDGKKTVAIKLFEESFGGRIEWVKAEKSSIAETLEQRLGTGENVDMVDYGESSMPYGAINEIYAPLDDYIDFTDPIWTDVKGLADNMAINGEHYVIPVGLTDVTFLTYSKSLLNGAGFEDPYELYKKGEWTYTKFIDMVNNFAAKSSGYRFGINGICGDALIKSTGVPIVSCENGKFLNNLRSAELLSAGEIFDSFRRNRTINPTFRTYMKSGETNTLFYAGGFWTLKKSQECNPELELGIVPLPKPDGAEKHYIDADISSYMLVNGSDKGCAVGAYLLCERVANTRSEYVISARESGLSEGDISEENYDRIMSMLDFGDENLIPAYDFGYGISTEMSYKKEFHYENADIMRKITWGLTTTGEGNPTTWGELVEEVAPLIDAELDTVNG